VLTARVYNLDLNPHGNSRSINTILESVFKHSSLTFKKKIISTPVLEVTTHKRTYYTILESADHALFKMVRYVLLRPLRPELDAKTKTGLPAKTRFCHLDEQAIILDFVNVIISIYILCSILIDIGLTLLTSQLKIDPMNSYFSHQLTIKLLASHLSLNDKF
jgi:hypothetical protein